MQEGIMDLNKEKTAQQHQAGTMALGPRVVLGGSSVWWALAEPEKPGMADRVLAGEPHQVLTYRCEQCAYLESYAP
ncbi:MAG: hypothetical protein C4534_08360 [Gaiellales bacterium]|nr:MAG: hypothetical protein C4534_08360 [Gaiellales bacterium]